MKISISAKQLTAKLLVKTRTGSYHGGMQQVSNVDGRDILWNYVKFADGKTQVVPTKEEAVGIVTGGKLYKFSSTSSELPSRFQIGSTVGLNLQGLQLQSQLIAVSFVPGKVLYTLAVYTSFTATGYEGQYGLINSIGWDDDGREYIRISNVDSSFVEEFVPVPEQKLSYEQPEQPSPDEIEKSAQFNAELHYGHGHVIPRADGMRTRCGALSTTLKCPVCAAEKRALDYAMNYMKNQPTQTLEN